MKEDLLVRGEEYTLPQLVPLTAASLTLVHFFVSTLYTVSLIFPEDNVFLKPTPYLESANFEFHPILPNRVLGQAPCLPVVAVTAVLLGLQAEQHTTASPHDLLETHQL